MYETSTLRFTVEYMLREVYFFPKGNFQARLRDRIMRFCITWKDTVVKMFRNEKVAECTNVTQTTKVTPCEMLVYLS